MKKSLLFFDKQDRELLALVNKFISKQHGSVVEDWVIDSRLHPNGIKALAVPRALRVAYAVINLLDSLEEGRAEDRLVALRSLHDEVLNSARTSLRYNTARVLIQIMKDLVRAHDNEEHQLRLAHDFRLASTGRPRLIRKLLKRYHLLEMPEEWDQLAFDSHVHDANTKGRKSPTHLIMDAWIKGIRGLTVIYYNHVRPEVADELLRAAKIMEMTVRIGIEYKTRFNGQNADFIWMPTGYDDAPSFLNFLSAPPVQQIMADGREVSEYYREHVLRSLEAWNTTARPAINERYSIELEPLSVTDFLLFVGSGEASLLHLAECLHARLLPLLEARMQILRKEWQQVDSTTRLEIEKRALELGTVNPHTILKQWIPVSDPLEFAGVNPEKLPGLLRLPPPSLLNWLSNLNTNGSIALNLACRSPEDVLELLWDCKGLITHLELFNLKEWQEGNLSQIEEINQLQLAINSGSAPRLKQTIRIFLQNMEQQPDTKPERIEKIRSILRNLTKLQALYSSSALKTHIGTDSTSRSFGKQGMGLVVPETLPMRSQRVLHQKKHCFHARIPVCMDICRQVSFREDIHSKTPLWLRRTIRMLPFMRYFDCLKSQAWVAEGNVRICTACEGQNAGNIVTLGGINLPPTLDTSLNSNRQTRHATLDPAYANTRLSNLIKVLIGFIPALLTFQLTQSWWLLAWFGAPLWFLITGLRNIVQAIFSGGGLNRGMLLRWNDYVSWSRLCDSLMYTGISVILLELLIRVYLLEDMLGLTVSESPILVFSIISTVNGFYIAAHNYYRGFPKEAIIGNIFRSALAIPIAMLYNSMFFELLIFGGSLAPQAMLEQCAAIISKIASDTVAAIIEGHADRANDIRLRHIEYQSKLFQLLDVYSRLEVLFPEHDLLSLVGKPRRLLEIVHTGAHDELRELIVHSLDLMYFWLYQPRSRDALRDIVSNMPPVERTLFARTQMVLFLEKDVSQLLVNGLMGRAFARPLSFYLDCHRQYIRDMNRLCSKRHQKGAAKRH